MLSFIHSSGVWALPLVALTITILALTVRCVIRFYLNRPARVDRLESSAQPILFWGALAAVLGVLGQCSGTYNAAKVIAGARAISPAMIARGVAEALSTTLWGLGLLLFSAVVWFVLRTRARRLAAGEVAAELGHTSA